MRKNCLYISLAGSILISSGMFASKCAADPVRFAFATASGTGIDEFGGSVAACNPESTKHTCTMTGTASATAGQTSYSPGSYYDGQKFGLAELLSGAGVSNGGINGHTFSLATEATSRATVNHNLFPPKATALGNALISGDLTWSIPASDQIKPVLLAWKVTGKLSVFQAVGFSPVTGIAQSTFSADSAQMEYWTCFGCTGETEGTSGINSSHKVANGAPDLNINELYIVKVDLLDDGLETFPSGEERRIGKAPFVAAMVSYVESVNSQSHSDFSHTAELVSITFEDGSTPESAGWIFSTDLGFRSPNLVPAPSTLSMLCSVLLTIAIRRERGEKGEKRVRSLF